MEFVTTRDELRTIYKTPRPTDASMRKELKALDEASQRYMSWRAPQELWNTSTARSPRKARPLSFTAFHARSKPTARVCRPVGCIQRRPERALAARGSSPTAPWDTSAA